MKIARHIFIGISLFVTAHATAQVGINNPTPHPTAALDIQASGNHKGLLIPHITSAEMTSINSIAAEGLMVFNSELKQFFRFDSIPQNWVSITGLKGNEDGSIHYIHHTSTDVKVGINTDDPQTTLDVNGTITTPHINSPSAVPDGGIMMWSGDVNANFNANGVGNIGSPLYGYALCNGGEQGSYTRPDLKGKFVVGLDPSNPDYSPTGHTGGEDKVALITNELPSHVHTGTTNSATSRISVGIRTKLNKNPILGGVGTQAWVDGSGSNTSTNIAKVTDPGHKHSFTTNSTGANAAHENRPSYYVVAYIIKIPQDKISSVYQ